MREPIKPEDIREGDLIRREPTDSRSLRAVEYVAARDGYTHGLSDSDTDVFYLLDRPKPAVDLPTEPTLGWATGLTKDRQPIVNAFGSWSNPSDLLNRTTWTYGDERGDLHLLGRTVTAFVEAVAVPKAALDELRSAHRVDAEPGTFMTPLQKAVRTFLAAVDAANGDPR